jgi:glucokinase
VPRVLGIDIGGTKLALALGGPDGRLEARMRRPMEPTGEARLDLARIVEDARRLVAEAGLVLEEVDVVGVSAPGPLDPARGLVLGPPNLPGWERAAVAETLETALGRPVFLENDANAAALAEWRFGAGAGLSNLVYLTMSTGVGGGIILGGRLYRGVASSAGEVGHAPVEVPGEPCACGLSGCLEAYVGGAAWTRRLRSKAPDSSRMLELAGGRGAITPVHAIAAAREADAFALAEMVRFNEYLARAIVSLAFTLAPQAVILGTIACAAGEELCLAPVRDLVRARTWPVFADDLRIVGAALGERTADYAGICAGLEALQSGA